MDAWDLLQSSVAQQLQVMGNIFVVTELLTLLIITRVSSGLKKILVTNRKYHHVLISASISFYSIKQSSVY